jgi:ABC-type Mn2+/Zn2+ transport system ATPase subunit
MAHLLQIEGLTYGYGIPLQSNLNVTLSRGEVLIVRGPNGSGKTTLIRTILSEKSDYRGKISSSVLRSRIAYLPQIENTEVHLPFTLEDILQTTGPSPLDWGWIESVGLLRKVDGQKLRNTASGGERKRTLLTRALLQNPKLLILDEPLNHLDTLSQTLILKALKLFLEEASHDEDRAIILVSHGNPELWSSFGDRVRFLDLGPKLQTSPTTGTNPKDLEVYN